jgi:prepilin-type N-terminal cleavage/methylation domain-containing protein
MRHRRARAASGFTLIELIVVVAILTILAGAALPVASRAWNSAARRATRERLGELARASLEFHRDSGREPSALVELFERPDDGVAWLGPYIAIEAREPGLGPHPGLLDAWSRPIELDAQGAFVLRSAAGDPGSRDDDLEVAVDFTPVRRELTLGALEEIETALGRWAELHPRATLPWDWPSARARLVADGCLDPRTPTSLDGWGRPFVADPLVPPEQRSAHPASLRVVSSALAERGMR